MKKGKRLVWPLAVITGLVITGFQFYWLFQTFSVGHANFLKTASNDLQKSVSLYQLQRNNGLLKRTTTDSTVAFFVTDSAKQPGRMKNWKRYNAGLSPGNMQTMKLLLSGMLGQVTNSPFAMKMIRLLYRQELKHDGITLDFNFTVLPGQHNLKPGSVSALLGLSGDSPVLVADFDGAGAYLFKQNLPNIIVSLALLLLTTGCLWYMAAEIRQQTRLQQLQTAFIANMAHEFRTPIAVLQSTHEALNQFGGLDDRDKAIRYLAANQLVLRKLENSIDRILTISPDGVAVIPLKMEEMSLRGLLEEVAGRYSQHVSELQLDDQMKNDLIYSDRFMLDSIITNLVENAFKYGGEGVRVVIKAIDQADGWQVEVQDNGPGIAARHLPYIFDRFYRVPQGDLHDTKGYGLGLSFVQELSGRLQGRATVASVPGEGSTFRIQFPASWKK
jgi:two-component system phosphate regulon sensor histidine kinase PhoR